MITVKVFKLGSAQAVRIPARYRLDVEEVEVFQRHGELVLRPRVRNAAEVFASARALAGGVEIKRPAQAKARPIPKLD